LEQRRMASLPAMVTRPLADGAMVFRERYSPVLVSRAISSVKKDINRTSECKDDPVFITGELIRQPDEAVWLTMLVAIGGVKPDSDDYTGKVTLQFSQ